MTPSRPPPLPPGTERDKLTSPTTTSTSSKRKSPSFSSVALPKMTSGDDRSDAGSTGSGTGSLSKKVKELFSKEKKQGSSTSSNSGAGEGSGAAAATAPGEGKPLLPPPPPPPYDQSLIPTTSTTSPPPAAALSPPPPAKKVTLLVEIAPQPAPLYAADGLAVSKLGAKVSGTGSGSRPVVQSKTGSSVQAQDDRTDLFHKTDAFRQAVDNAQKSVDRLTTAATWLNVVGSTLEAGGSWLPMVGEAVKVVVSMLDSAKAIGVAKVAALRLVERCARIMEAVVQTLERNRHKLTMSLRQDVDRLLTNVHNTAYLLSKLANRPFFKLWLHSQEVYDQIQEASEDLKSYLDIFQVQNALGKDALLVQMREDREADMQILRDMVDRGIRDDNVLLSMLVRKSEEQQEAIKTLQRALDSLLASNSRSSANIVPSDSYPFSDNSPTTSMQETSPDLWRVPPLPATHPPMSLPPPAFKAAVGSTAAQLSFGDVTPPTPPPGRRFDMDLTTVDLMAFSAYDASVPPPKEGDEDLILPVYGPDVDPRREFLEKALNVLRRHSASTNHGVPDWTITSLEVTHEARIASSFFSVVWRGKWQGETVAIKELNSVTDQALFIKEVEVWRRLKSRHILPFLGASSTTGPPPWFLVSPYLRHGNILSVLNQNSRSAKLPLIHQMAQGLEYLHSRDIIHGDFKAANVLITDIGEAVICDFGLSQIKMDITSKSSKNAGSQRALSGTMRWQSPERLQGHRATFACDVYSFAITICELYGGQTPFGYVDDEIVRREIIEGGRPVKPQRIPGPLWKLVLQCWAQDPDERPTFEEIARDMKGMYELPQNRKESQNTASTSTSESASAYTTASEGNSYMSSEQHAISPELGNKPLPTEFDNSSSSDSLHSIPQHLEKELSFESDRAERHYRHYLQHDFDDRLTIPLWFPSAVPLGSIGYIRHGQFVKLMDAHAPPADIPDIPPMPKMDEFASLQTFKTPVHVRNAAERGWDMVNSLTSFIRTSGETWQKLISRRMSFQLKPGMKQATLIVGDGQFEIYKSFAEARAYLTANIDWIIHHYGDAHHLVKEDIILVVGTLTAHNWAIIVSNFAPRTTLTFNVHAENQRQPGQPWGTWTVNRQPAPDAGRSGRGSLAPMPEEEERVSPHSSEFRDRRIRVDEPELKYTCKVSTVSASPMDAVILAKLKFAPGSSDPTLYNP